jgi:hypothetical protein
MFFFLKHARSIFNKKSFIRKQARLKRELKRVTYTYGPDGVENSTCTERCLSPSDQQYPTSRTSSILCEQHRQRGGLAATIARAASIPSLFLQTKYSYTNYLPSRPKDPFPRRLHLHAAIDSIDPKTFLFKFRINPSASIGGSCQHLYIQDAPY